MRRVCGFWGVLRGARLGFGWSACPRHLKAVRHGLKIGHGSFGPSCTDPMLAAIVIRFRGHQVASHAIPEQPHPVLPAPNRHMIRPCLRQINEQGRPTTQTLAWHLCLRMPSRYSSVSEQRRASEKLAARDAFRMTL
ncbi:hypothetical protein B0T16DRAFT_210355 [Cercophora newfieldiana]|uniref:Uncharacterized protein n=1 Tax=Cercophora newfieldiana TaxID=92897 RepID=A0AA39XVT7_9PEZI|nr:hypothetical protein B0T16DRAFT_210355 [Cercophora newfieldiana]